MKFVRMILVFVGVGLGTMFVVGGNSDIDKVVVLRDDCDPDDPSWNAIGGCTRQQGDVTLAEFQEELLSPRSPGASVGHQSWRNDPSYTEVVGDEHLKVKNRGGRTHTFTEVAEFGGGRLLFLNGGMAPAPECLIPTTSVAPGESITVEGLASGNHRFQCCLHPWMRALVKVHPEN